eukprot:2525246-Prymnesium_polylepis.1
MSTGSGTSHVPIGPRGARLVVSCVSCAVACCCRNWVRGARVVGVAWCDGTPPVGCGLRAPPELARAAAGAAGGSVQP